MAVMEWPVLAPLRLFLIKIMLVLAVFSTFPPLDFWIPLAILQAGLSIVYGGYGGYRKGRGL